MAERYRLLTLAIVEAARSDRTEEIASLLSERASVLDALERIPKVLLPIEDLRRCAEIDGQAAEAMAASQASTVHHLVGSFRGRQGAQHYRRRDPAAPKGAFVTEG